MPCEACKSLANEPGDHEAHAALAQDEDANPVFDRRTGKPDSTFYTCTSEGCGARLMHMHGRRWTFRNAGA